MKPTNFIVKHDDSPAFWKCIGWWNKNYPTRLTGDRGNDYYIFDDEAQTFYFYTIKPDYTKYTEYTAQEFVNKFIDKISINKIQTSRSALERIHDIACDSWKSKILELTKRNPFDIFIELDVSEVDEMFKAATPAQKPILEDIFGDYKPKIDFSKLITEITDNGEKFILPKKYSWTLFKENDDVYLIPKLK